MGAEGAGERRIVGVAQRRADDPAAVVHLLVQALDVPGGIVRHDEHRLGVVADGSIDLHGIDPERSVAVDRDHLAVGHRQRRRDGERHADAEAAERAGIHVGPCLQAGAGEAQEIAAVGDRHIIGIGNGGDGIEDGARMDFAVGTRRRPVLGGRGGRALAVTAAQSFGPRLVETGLAVAGGLEHCGKRELRRGQQLRLAAAIVDELARRCRRCE